MFFDQIKENQLEQHSIKNDRQLQELLIRIDGLDNEIKNLMQELQVTPTQVATFVADKENFTEENWEQLQQQRKMLDEKLSLEKNSISDPLRTRKVQAERHVAPHWIFVR